MDRTALPNLVSYIKGDMGELFKQIANGEWREAIRTSRCLKHELNAVTIAIAGQSQPATAEPGPMPPDAHAAWS